MDLLSDGDFDIDSRIKGKRLGLVYEWQGKSKVQRPHDMSSSPPYLLAKTLLGKCAKIFVIFFCTEDHM
jgi:hypothetical protein